MARLLSAGTRVAVGDGAGAPVGLGAILPEAAEAVGGISLLCGWCFAPPTELPHSAFREVRAIMGGHGLRAALRAGHARYVPARYGSMPALLRGALRPDVLLASLVPVAGGLSFATEAGWQQAAVDAGVRVVAEVNHGLPHAAATPVLPLEQVVVIGEVDRPPLEFPGAAPDAVALEIGDRVAALIPAGAALQVAPGMIGDAVLQSLEQRVHLHGGIVGDGAVRLAERGLLVGQACASYVAGGPNLYAWADGLPIASGVDATHDPARLGSFDALVAVNTALQLDMVGNVNAQGFGSDVIGGVGGLADFASAASRAPGGLSVIALPTLRRGQSTLVERLWAPVSLNRTDVDVVVTERGTADLRGLSDGERSRALDALWSHT